jgi:glycosyltransferase A (GT-A) superfamily protein (DUF2064 family)
MKFKLFTLVKTPGYSPLKTRLAATQGEEFAHQFYMECLQKISLFMTQAQNLNWSVYWSISEKEAMNEPLWSVFSKIDQGSGGLGDRLFYLNSQKNAHETVVLIGSDAPQIHINDLKKVESLLSEKEDFDIVFGASCDGGFWLFASQIILPSAVWNQVTYSQNSTLADLIQAILAWDPTLKISTQQMRKLTDVDEFKDIVAMKKEIINGF